MSARSLGRVLPVLVLEVVEHVGDPAGKGEHDDEEGDEEHADILHHRIDAQDDRSKIF